MSHRAYTANRSARRVDPAATLDFAKWMLRTVRRRRKAQLEAGEVTQTQHDADVAAARSLVELAEKAFLARTPLN